MKSGRSLIALIVVFALSCVTLALAQEHGSKDEAVALVNAAIDHVKKVGPEQAFKDFTTDKSHWTKKDLYVIAFDMKGNMQASGANEKMVGKNYMEMKDANGALFTAE
jgi:cytochrome c